ncbi:MAG: acetoin utilization protein AcuC [Thermodesulfobacteriota bacterium]|nr:acetoin utilization protein AcuC [Thermodesulfobacteriota bacterium]
MFLYTPKFNDFSYGSNHPLKVDRARMLYELCYRYSLLDHPWMKVIEPDPSTSEVMLEFHTPGYVDALEGANSGAFEFTMLPHGLGNSDNPVFKGMFDLALLVLGATLKGEELIAHGQADCVFNPLGGFHHAGPDVAEGFCLVNDIVIAINRLLNSGYQRILYVDIDAHHGNGVQDAFYDTDRVLFFSQHQTGEGIYPWVGFETEIGEGKGLGYTVNMPVPEYTDDDAYLKAFMSIYPAIAKAYKPEVVVAQIGLDILKKDPLTNLRCTNNSYSKVIQAIGESCDKILALGGGGYSTHDVARGWCLAWSQLNHIEPEDPYAGMVGSALYGHGNAGDSLFDDPHRISAKLRRSVDRIIDEKIRYIKETIFPILGIAQG